MNTEHTTDGVYLQYTIVSDTLGKSRLHFFCSCAVVIVEHDMLAGS